MKKHWDEMAAKIHAWARGKGFWEEGVDRNDGEMIALMHFRVERSIGSTAAW